MNYQAVKLSRLVLSDFLHEIIGEPKRVLPWHFVLNAVLKFKTLEWVVKYAILHRPNQSMDKNKRFSIIRS